MVHMALLNERIIEEIEKSNYSENTKKFLKEILMLEIDHSEEDRWWYSEVYYNLVRKAVK